MLKKKSINLFSILDSPRKFNILQFILIINLLPKIPNQKEYNEELSVFTSRIFKDAPKLSILINFLFEIKALSIDNPVNKLLMILSKNLPKENKPKSKSFMHRLKITSIWMELMKDDLFRLDNLNEKYETIFIEFSEIQCKVEEKFREILGNEMISSDNISCYFKNSRDPFSLFQYVSNLQDQDLKTLEAIPQIINQIIFSQNAYSQRYSTENNPHLAYIKEHYPEVFNMWSNVYRTSSLKRDDCQVEISDHSHDMLLSGTEIIGSCQHIKSNIGINRGLLGYILDGKCKLLLRRNSQGCIVARHLFRLLLNQNNQPVIHFESLYANPGFDDDLTKQTMVILAQQYAHDIGVPLAGNIKSKNSDKVIFQLKSLGGNSPFEYVDSAQGLREMGEYDFKLQ